jgi:hypothetical protein
MNAQHTPGPWEVFKGLYGYGIKGICGGYHGDIDIEADARLIAAAPELLDALKQLTKDAERVKEVMLREVGIGMVDEVGLSLARAAIAKAAGGGV